VVRAPFLRVALASFLRAVPVRFLRASPVLAAPLRVRFLRVVRLRA
jgi:hypothetical protein